MRNCAFGLLFISRFRGCSGFLALAVVFSAPADVRHLRGHDGQEEDVGVEREARHVDDRPCDVLHVDGRFGGEGAGARMSMAVAYAFNQTSGRYSAVEAMCAQEDRSQ